MSTTSINTAMSLLLFLLGEVVIDLVRDAHLIDGLAPHVLGDGVGHKADERIAMHKVCGEQERELNIPVGFRKLPVKLRHLLL